jgi:membrane protein
MDEPVLSAGPQIVSPWALGGLTRRELFRRVWGGIARNDLINRAYELAYNFLLAVFPMLLFLIGMLGIFAAEGSKLRSDLFYSLQLALPPSAYDLIAHTMREVTLTSNGGKLTFGLLFALFAGSSGMTQMMSTLNAAYEVRERRAWITVHLVSLGLTLAMSVLLIAALFLILAGGHAVASLGRDVGLNTAAFVAIKILQWVVALTFVVSTFATIYYFAPNLREQHWYWLTPGSVVGVAVWAAASAGLRIYLHFFNSYTRVYGSVGAVIVLMLWFYVTGLAFLIGGQINATIVHAAAQPAQVEAKAHGEKTTPGAKAA